MSTKTVLETLEAARKRITPESAWTTKALARDLSGNEVPAFDESACKWCMWGAVIVALGGWVKPYVGVRRRLEGLVGYAGTFNDSHTHAEVLAAFDAAIAKERATHES